MSTEVKNSKRMKEETENGVTTESAENVLNSFKFNSLLNESSNSKVVFIHGLKKSEEDGDSGKDAVIILEKPHFTANEIKAIIEENFSTDLTLSNDIYKKLSIYPSKPFNSKRSQI